MKIRGKLLALLLVIALVPLCLSAALNQLSMHRLGQRLATDSRDLLEETAREYLLGEVDYYRRLLQRDQEILRVALELQAAEVERRLAVPPPRATPVLFAAQLDRNAPRPAELKLSERQTPAGRAGLASPTLVTYEAQSFFLPAGTTAASVDSDLKRLSTLTEAYRQVRQVHPDLFYWQYTTLTTGLHSSFPGHGGYPAKYDPRKREWYRQAEATGTLTQQVVNDASTGLRLLTVSLPVHRPDGSFAGVTAIDVAYDWLFAGWKLPERWAGQAESMIAALRHVPGTGTSIEILLRDRAPREAQDWQRPPQREFLTSKDDEALAAIGSDILAGRSGVRQMALNGAEALVAYSPALAGAAFPLLVVPSEVILLSATRAEAYFASQVSRMLQLSSVLLLAVILWVVVTAYFRSRSITRPVAQLADAAGRLAEGDFEISVTVQTGDELETLGEAFNVAGPKLRERAEMKQSLAVAREIQQLLLPAVPPTLSGFEVAGRTVYCDETGGDYFDFIDIGGNRVGLAVGDVTGHGIGAALLMAAARGVLRSQAARHGTGVERLCVELNRHLVRDTPDTLFMTLFYGVLDGNERCLHWISAGHGPNFLYKRRSASFTKLPSCGIPLGIMEPADFATPAPAILERGDILLIGTDGIWEACGPDGEQFGTDRLQGVVAASAEAPAETIIDTVLAAVETFRGEAPQGDDLTLLVIKG